MVTLLQNALVILRLREVIKRTGLSRSSIYALMKLGQFPLSVKMSARSVGWVEAEVSDFIQARINESRC
jgi:prophage regulatory protein